jgi:superoxide reductase
MKVYLCKVCGHLEFDAAPGQCPVCMAPQTSFEEKNDILKRKGAGEVGGEAEKKHLPAFTVVRTCGLIPQGCTDVHIKIGETEHPSTPEHHIMFIDLYLDNKYIARTYLTPASLHPAVAFHIKASSGTLTAVERCNLHGYWAADTTL